MKGFLAEESGQATTEYILMLFIAVSLAVTVFKQFVQPHLGRLSDLLVARLEAGLFGRGGGFHYLRVGQ